MSSNNRCFLCAAIGKLVFGMYMHFCINFIFVAGYTPFCIVELFRNFQPISSILKELPTHFIHFKETSSPFYQFFRTSELFLHLQKLARFILSLSRKFQTTWNLVDVNQRGTIPVRRVKFILR